MTELERRYRFLLKLLPRQFADKAGSELLGMWMDAAQPKQRWPRAADVWDLLKLSFIASYTRDTNGEPLRVVLTGCVLAAQLLLSFDAAMSVGFWQHLSWTMLLIGFASMVLIASNARSSGVQRQDLFCASLVVMIAFLSALPTIRLQRALLR